MFPSDGADEPSNERHDERDERQKLTEHWLLQRYALPLHQRPFYIEDAFPKRVCRPQLNAFPISPFID